MLKASEFVKVNKTKTLAKFITKFITAVKSFMIQASSRQRCKTCNKLEVFSTPAQCL
jgi:hypothetical protein